MKNRKLFAIITLVAFMLTMMPLMAFATTASGSSISVDDGSAKVVTEKNGVITVDALKLIVDLDSAVAKDQFVILFAERNGSLSDADYFKVGAKPLSPYTGTWDQYIGNVTAGYVVLPAGTVGENEIYVFSKNAGTVKFKAYLISKEAFNEDNIATYYNGSSELLRAALVGNGCTGKFNTADGTVVIAPTVTPDGFSMTSSTKDDVTTYAGADANSGLDVYKVNTLITKGGTKMVGEDVTISVDKDGATVNKTEATTSATGKVDFKVSASKPGTYTVTIEAAGTSKDIKFTFGANAIGQVKVSYTVNGNIAVDANETVAMMFTAYDANGNILAPTTTNSVLADVENAFDIEVESAPADSALEDTTIAFRYDPNVTDGLYASFRPDAVGAYTIKVYNVNTGAASRTTINAAEFGTIDHATISYPAATYSLGAKTQTPTVYVYDQNGVKKQATSKKFSYTGLGVSDFEPTTGQITFKNDSDYAGKEVVVSVVANGKYAASTTLTIGAEPAALQFADTNAEVGSEAKVALKVVDVNGNATAVSAANGVYNIGTVTAIITEKPEGANASVDADSIINNVSTFLKKGTGSVTLTSNKEGTVKANVVVELIPQGNYADPTNKNQLSTVYLSGIATANFGAVAPEKGTGDTVTLIIGSTTFVANGSTYTSDVAPYVAGGRTFVPVRAFAEATGAKVEYDAATQVITITGEGITAQMTIGSNILTVNGETVVMDAAAAVTAEGRTVLPVRYAGQALGYDFECAYGSNGAVTSVTMFK